MTTLTGIEQAADALPREQKQQLMLFLGARLRADGPSLPEPRQFSPELIQSWIAEDEADWRRLRAQG